MRTPPPLRRRVRLAPPRREADRAASRERSIDEALASAEKGSDTERRDELNKLASRLETASGSASDAAKVRTLTETVQRLAAVPAVAHAGGTE